MRQRSTRISTLLFATAAMTTQALAQASTPCTSAAPNPFHLVQNWADTPRPWAPASALTVDAANNLWVVDRCEDKGCATSNVPPIFQLSPGGKAMKNFGAGLFVEPHAIAADKEGNVWVADAGAVPGRGMQVIKFNSAGKVLVTLGKAGQGAGSKALDIFDAPTGVAVASNGDLFVSEGHGEKQNNSRIMKFSKDGKFIKSFGTWGTGDGQMRSPHAIAIDSQDRLFVGDRGNSRVVVFDKEGKFLAAWKQFGRPSGIYVDHNDMLYVIDSQSTETPGERYSPGCGRGIRIGSTKDGKVVNYIPPPPPADPKWQPPIGVAADRNGAIYAASDDQKDVKKFVRN